MSHERTSGVRVGVRCRSLARAGGQGADLQDADPAGTPEVGAVPGMGDHRGVAADKRGSKTVRDLALSLVVLGFVVFSIYLFIPHDSQADPVRKVPFAVELGQARRDAPYPVAGPEGLGADWRSTSVRYDAADPAGVTWHIGFVDPEQEYVAVEQSNGPAEAFISQVTKKSHRDGDRTVTIGGQVWQRYAGGRYPALVRRDPGVTTVVLGTAADADLRRMAAALRSTGGH